MTDKKIVEKALRKAVYDGDFDWIDFAINKCSFSDSLRYSKDALNDFISWLLEDCNINCLLFYIPFVKAFWGDDWDSPQHMNDEVWNGHLTDEGMEECCSNATDRKSVNGKRWQYHSQQIVTKKNRLKYMEKFLLKPRAAT